MTVHQLIFQQHIPTSIAKAWEFFSSPYNLEKITPGYMNFRILLPEESSVMYEGMLIAYIVSPIARIPVRWITEITKINKGNYFIDEQRSGPFGLWHHEHHFQKTADGVLMIDKLIYGLPLGFVGSIAHALFVKKNVASIFSYREKKIRELFG